SELGRTIDVIVRNGSPSAIAVLEEVLPDERQREDYIVAWLRDPLLRHRHDVALLEACQRLLTGNELSKARKRAMVEALFNYEPERWYHPESPPPLPPARDTLSDGARQLLLDIAQQARAAKLLRGGEHRRIRKELG
ncbi:MAG: hypothetical protein AAFX85_17565, partial [Pseudomonadota bacterium]